MFDLDPAHSVINLFNQTITQDVWKDKYRYKDESHPFDSMYRVSKAIMGNESEDNRNYWIDVSYRAMTAGLWMPGGRIQAGAGTERHVTLHNCYVNGTLQDSMEGIMEGLTNAALTLRQGGGIGTDFTPLRPKGAALKRLGEGAMSSGSRSFMNIWDAMCATIMSAGYRRGAMMGTLACWHPDIEDFIKAKHTAGALTNFNLSVLVTDKFMHAVHEDDSWDLWHYEPPVDGALASYPDPDGHGRQRYVYKSMPARELWEKILRSTHEYSEPGVIFIDRINSRNNLSYAETISCTNPCGEQPLPPHGACDLGAINLARLVRDPFKDSAHFDIYTLKQVVRLGVRFLDNVIDVSKYPLPEQEQEQKAKRRIGLGISGLGSALVQLGARYGDDASVHATASIMRIIAETAYETSCVLAQEKGKFPLYNPDKFLKAPFIQSLPEDILAGIEAHGIRNGVLLTIAPVGTNSLYYGNCSSGLEPIFSFTGKRKVRQPDGSWESYAYTEYSLNLWEKMYPGVSPLSSQKHRNAFVSAKDLTVTDHLNIQAACQRWVDASVSKTINCPKGISFEDFKSVYETAYAIGCKGCTTYTPSDVRGSILEADSGTSTAPTGSPPSETQLGQQAAPAEIPQNPNQADPHDGPALHIEFAHVAPTPFDGSAEQVSKLAKRPGVMQGKTYKIKWPSREGALYITINDLDGRPYEIFVNSRSAENAEWITALTRMISSVMRQTSDIKFIPEELMQVASAHDGQWVNQRHFASLVAYLGYVIKCHIEGKDPSALRQPHNPDMTASAGMDAPKISASETPELNVEGFWGFPAIECPKCRAIALTKQEGCEVCVCCGYSTCS